MRRSPLEKHQLGSLSLALSLISRLSAILPSEVGETMEGVVETCEEAIKTESCASNCPQLYDICHKLLFTTSEMNMTNSSSSSITTAEAYGYGFLMIFIISLLSLLGVIIVPFVKGNGRLLYIYKNIIYFLISVGVGALVTDALLHLIPHALNAHDHGDEEGEGHEDLNERDVVLRMCVVVAGALSFFLLELFLQSCASSFGHTHSHRVYESTMSLESNNPGGRGGGGGGGGKHRSKANGGQQAQKSPSSLGYGALRDDDDGDDTNVKYSKPGCLTSVTSIKPLAWVIVVGDGMHNLTDGLAVGVAISQSLGLGLSTGLAILFHEIPHELSDYAILLHTGMSWYKALLLNFASALTALLGFFIGVAIGTDSEESNQWLLAIIAGQFLYIALVDLLPEVLHTKEKGWDRVIQLIMTFLGLSLGFTVLFLIALYEEQINVSVE